MAPDISDAKLIQVKNYVQEHQPHIGLMRIVDFIVDHWPKDQVEQEWIIEASPESIGNWVINGIELVAREKRESL